MYIYILLSSLAFAFIAWRNFNLALAVLFVLLPTYLIRFNIGPLPTTLLEIMIWVVLVVWVVKKRHQIFNFQFSIFKKLLVTRYWLLVTGIILFLLGATISIYTSLDVRSALGEWKAFYIEPILIFLVLATTLRTNTPPAKGGLGGVNAILFALILSGLITSILSIYQHFTGFGVPSAFWENGNSYRVTAWYGFPNAVGLFLAPLIPLAFYLLYQSYTILKKRDRRYVIGDKKLITYHLSLITSLLFIPSSLLAIIYAKSIGSLIGILSGIFVLLLLYKKTRAASIIILISGILILTLLPTSNPIKQELFFQDRSGQIRIAIYKETFELLKDRPLLGTGLASYAKRIEPYHTTVNGEGIEIFHHPHNIFLTMWVNLGIIGLAGFVLIVIWFFKESLSHITYHISRNNQLPKFLLSAMTVVLITGLVDSPYIKNDLALLFWLLPTLMFINTKLPQTESQSV